MLTLVKEFLSPFKSILIWSGVLLATNALNTGVSYLIFWNQGYAQRGIEYAAAETMAAQKHSRWLVDVLQASGDDDVANAATNLSNEEKQRVIYDAIARSAGRGFVLTDDFLQHLNQLR